MKHNALLYDLIRLRMELTGRKTQICVEFSGILKGGTTVQLIFVPGIKGTELWDNQRQVWFPKTQQDLDTLRIENKLNPGEPLGLVNAFGVHVVEIYNHLLDAYPEPRMFRFKYDWRHSMEDHAEALSTKIKELSQTDNPDRSEPVTIIAHSMGGMVAKMAILKLEKEGRSKSVTKLVTFGTPWLGSPDAYKALAHGEPGIFESLFNFFRLFDDKQTRKLARQYPSVYQLIPHPDYFKKPNGKFVVSGGAEEEEYNKVIRQLQAFYNEENKQTDDDVVADVYTDFIKPVHDAMTQPLPDHIVHDCLVGCEQPTLYKVPSVVMRHDVTRVRFKASAKFLNGDGVVPLASAVPPHSSSNVNMYFAKVEHVALLASDEGLGFLKWSVEDNQGHLPLGISTSEDYSPSEEVHRGIFATIKCPVDYTVNDSDGRYVSGVYDPNQGSAISPLVFSHSVTNFSIGESKYLYIKDPAPGELTFSINGYETGVADVSVQHLQAETVETVEFDPIPVSRGSSAKLTVPVDTPRRSRLTVGSVDKEPQDQPSTIYTTAQIAKIDEPVPNLKVQLNPSENSKKAYRRRVFYGAVQVKITSDSKSIDKIFFQIDDQPPIRYSGEQQVLYVESGSHQLTAFGKDRFGRPTETVVEEFQVDNLRPTTQLRLLITPAELLAYFTQTTQGSRAETKFQIVYSDHETEWTEAIKEMSIPWGPLAAEPGQKLILKYKSTNEFDESETEQSFTISLGDIPALMWEEHSRSYVTPQTVWSNLTKYEKVDPTNFESYVLLKRESYPVDASKALKDNVNGVSFRSENITIDVMFAESYSLYFSGPPTEVLNVGQQYNFSFQLVTDRSQERITHTSPSARLHPVRKRDVPDKQLAPLTQRNGVFYGSFKVDESFNKYNYRLVIVDEKNTQPPLREIPLIMIDGSLTTE
jgi:pimeloyl-ACP methyl ester carboxylesterase